MVIIIFSVVKLKMSFIKIEQQIYLDFNMEDAVVHMEKINKEEG